MRHKQRPLKSSRSVTFVIKGQTSFASKQHNNPTGSQTKHIHNLTRPILPSTSSAHMSEVMRLAFLENNDICIEDWTKVDFNSASILQRTIQQRLQQERQEQQQQQQQQLHQHQQLHLQQQTYVAACDREDLEEEDDDHNQDGAGAHHFLSDYNNHHHHHHHQDNVAQSDHYLEDDDADDDDFEDPLRIKSPAPHQRQHQQHQNQQHHQHHQHQHHQQQRPTQAQQQRQPTTHHNHRHLRNQQHQQPQQQQQQQQPRAKVASPAQRLCEGFLCEEPNCGKSFPSLRKLRHHKVVHSDEFPFVCQFDGCTKKFKRKFGIDLHSTTHFDLDPEMYAKTSNNSSLPFFGRRMQYSMCKPCGQKFKTVHEYQFHMLKHGKEPFKCPVKGCGQTFSIWKSFQKHRASHYFNYYCKMDSRCTHHTSNLQLLKLHIYCCHFKRKLPENARDISVKDEQINVVDSDGEETFEEPMQDQEELISVTDNQVGVEEDEEQEEEEEEEEEPQESQEPQEPLNQPIATPRSVGNSSRLRRNPPRSSTSGHQDYASINNGFLKQSPTTTTTRGKRARA